MIVSVCSCFKGRGRPLTVLTNGVLGLSEVTEQSFSFARIMKVIACGK